MAWIGKWIIGVGVIHTIFGLVFMRDTLIVLWLEGIVNTVNGQPAREATFWFLYTGILFLLLGVMVNRFEKLNLMIPMAVVLGLWFLTLIGLVVMPLSGIWLLVPPTVGMFYHNRRLRVKQGT